MRRNDGVDAIGGGLVHVGPNIQSGRKEYKEKEEEERTLKPPFTVSWASQYLPFFFFFFFFFCSSIDCKLPRVSYRIVLYCIVSSSLLLLPETERGKQSILKQKPHSTDIFSVSETSLQCAMSQRRVC